MDAAWWGVVVGGATLVVAVITVWLMTYFRRLDQAHKAKAAVVRLVRESEKRRPLWNYSCRLSPGPSYRSVQEFRKDVATARALIPPSAPAAADLDVMKRAAELFSDRYEELARQSGKHIRRRGRPVDAGELGRLLASLRSTAVPALEELRERYDIPAGQRPSDNLLSEDAKEIGTPPPNK
jgi:hypothetical protein